MRVAFFHDYLNVFGGAERVLQAMHEIYPDAPIYTTLLDPTAFPESFPMEKVIAPPSLNNSVIKRLSKQVSFIYPLIFEQIDLHDYEVLISSSAGFAKGIVPLRGQLHISYCHTPKLIISYSIGQ